MSIKITVSGSEFSDVPDGDYTINGDYIEDFYVESGVLNIVAEISDGPTLIRNSSHTERQILRARMRTLNGRIAAAKEEQDEINAKLRTPEMSKCGGFDDPCGDSFECTKCYRDAPGWGI